jgi:ABC-type dipeptide/oligopeptide/nickel transport system permease component
MGTYLVRRLLIMIPTLFGITVVSFCIMQLAPGDPAASKVSGGAVGQSTQNADVYELRKRELHLDLPLLLNFNYFRNYTTKIHWAAFYGAQTSPQIEAELPQLAAANESPADHPELAERVAFLHSLGIPDFNVRLADPERSKSLADAVVYYVGKFFEDTGSAGVPTAIAILQDADANLQLKIGAIRGLVRMAPEPFVFTYSKPISDAQTPAIVGAWQIWWDRNNTKLPKPDAEARKFLDGCLAQMTVSNDQLKAQIDAIDEGGYLPVATAYFAERLLGESTLAEKVAASTILRKIVSVPLMVEVPPDASAKDVEEATAVWLEHYKIHRAEYEPPLAKKLWNVVADTQYANMVAKLVTFRFGQSALRTREWVSEKIWTALVVSAPLIFLSELLIYLIAIPLGIVCGVYRGKWIDQGISLGLFVLYSIPGFVAGMLFLVFFCYGDYLKWFPEMGLHSENADALSFLPWLRDYLWHAFLPVVCLSLFSLAAIAMYSRSALLDVINQDYIRTARAKGVSGPVVIFKHALRNALIPILTLFSTFLPSMLGGAVLIEYLFNIPGIGRLGLNSIEDKDFPTLMALLYIEALVTLVSFLITDLLYVVVDPRISFEGRGDSA